ncbi:MAG: LysR family transcriptional regulator [Deltaproteobacteria bacterium]|nr:LysR family transcriptional regulator [Deltaproteobacteria bacterium]
MQTHEELRWDDVRVLLALIRRGSLKRAAEDLRVNISTVSRRLDALESSIEAHLFDRTPEGTRPTAAAEQLLPFAESMEQAALGLTRGLESFEVNPEGVVRLTAPPGVVDHFLAPALVDLHTAYPKLRLQLNSSIGYADLTRREADIALRMLRPATGDFLATKLATGGNVIIASTAFAKSIGTLRDPSTTRWITWGDDLTHLPDALWLAKNVSRQRVVLETSSMSAQVEAVRTGLGVMLAPVPYADLPGLCAVRCSPALRKKVEAIPAGSLWLVGHRALREVPRVAVVWEWLKQRFSTL